MEVLVPKCSAGLALIAACLGHNFAAGATVKMVLSIDGLGNYQVRACACGNNGFGLASYSFQLINVLTIDHVSPRMGFGLGPNGVGPAGFNTLRTPDNGLGGVVFASQDTITPTANLIRGFGQRSSSFDSLGITDFTQGTQLESPEWEAYLLVAKGTYRVDRWPDFFPGSVDIFANVFVSQAGTAVKSAEVETIRNTPLLTPPPDYDPFDPSRNPCIPEPASLAMASMGLIGLVLRRRNG